MSQNEEIGSLRDERAGVQRENSRLRSEITKLRTDPEHLELLARKNLGLILADEVAYVVLEPPIVLAPQKEPKRSKGFWETLSERVWGLGE